MRSSSTSSAASWLRQKPLPESADMRHYLLVEVGGCTGPDRPGFAAARRRACLGCTGKRLLAQSYALVIVLGTILCCTWHNPHHLFLNLGAHGEPILSDGSDDRFERRAAELHRRNQIPLSKTTITAVSGSPL